MTPAKLFLLVLLLPALLLPAWAGNITVCPSGCDEASPKAAIAGAAPHDVISLAPGEYRGNLVVDKPLTLEGAGGPVVIMADGPTPLLTVASANVTLRGLQLSDTLGRTGVLALLADGLVVRGCTIDGAATGILAARGSGVTLEGNTIRHARMGGITLETSGEALVQGNEISGSGSGVRVTGSPGATLRDNRIADCSDGILLERSGGATVSGNTFSRCARAVTLSLSDGNRIAGNTATGSGLFLGFTSSSGNGIGENRVEGYGTYASEALSLGNTFRWGPMNLTGAGFNLSRTPVAPPSGFRSLADPVNITFPAGAAPARGWVNITASIPEKSLGGADPWSTGIYRLDGEPVCISRTSETDGAMSVEATVEAGGTYALLAREGVAAPPLALPLLAVLLGLAIALAAGWWILRR